MPHAVLICDDDPACRTELRKSLHGFEVVEAETSVAARAALETRAFYAVVADALDVLQFVRIAFPATIRFLVSGLELEVVVREVNDGAAHRFFQKPWDAEKLRTALEHVLQARVAGG